MYKGILTVSLFIALNFNIGACKQGCATAYGPCPGNRPRIPAEEGCCPARVGEACGVDVGVFCDGELGYKCIAEDGLEGRGICQGQYKLHRTINEERRLSIKWRAFAPPNYNMEYSLLHRSYNYSTNLSTWNVIECGDEPEYTLTSLKPATWYFIRIGVWSIPFHPDNKTYSNVTETLMIKTKDVEYCEHVGKQYEVGEVFNHNNEDRCTCLNTGELVCTSLCPNISNQACETLPGRFDCLEGDCETIQANCSINGSVYMHGEVFEQGCTECQCNNGNATCIVPSNCVAMEPTEACPKPQSHKIEGDCCPTWTCGPSQPTSCTYKGKEYSQGYDWLDEETCEQCQCESGEVACYYFCEEPVLPEDCPRPHRRRAPNGCCEIYECLQPVDICVYANGTFHQGEFLTGNQCELCVCSLNNTVECSPRCREVHLPLPTVVCPEPRIRRDGCCDTLFCHEPEIDITTAIKNIYASSYGPNSVTVSFKAKQIEDTKDEKEGHLTDYQLHFADAEEAGVPSNWKTTNARLAPVIGQAEEPIRPSRLLQTTGAFLVGDRAYITISNLRANTTYYFTILPYIRQASKPHDAEVTQHTTLPTTIIGLLAVKTLAKNLTCSIKDRTLQHDESYQDDCNRRCKCRMGDVDCINNCPQLNGVLLPSASCPFPKLEILNGSCCPTWTCSPDENGCKYDNMILKDGEQYKEGCDKICTCKSGKIKCRPVCTVSTVPPRHGCRKQQIVNHCCMAWMCPPDKREVRSVESVLQTTFTRPCLQPVEEFKWDFVQELTVVIKRELCSGLPAPENQLCSEMDIVINCPQAVPTKRHERDTAGGFTILFGISIPRRSNESVSKLNASLHVIIDGLSSMFNTTKGQDVQVESVQFTSSGNLALHSLHFACDDGYTFFKDLCVRTEILNKEPSFRVELSPISVGSESAVLGWESLSKLGVTYVTALQIEYKEENYTTWNQTSNLEPHVTKHTLTELQSESIYRARLVALTNLGTKPRVPTGELIFKTKSVEVEFLLTLENVQVGQTSVVIRWRPLPEEELQAISTVDVTFNEINQPATSKNISSKPSNNQCIISNLKQATSYKAVINILFYNGTRLHSGTIHFVTDSADKSSNLAIPLAVSAVVIVTAIVIVVITCCLWRKSRLRNNPDTDTAFENKVFGIQIHNDGRTLSART